MEWSNVKVFEFLELYRVERVIWDPKHLCHKDKTKVNDSWLRIAAAVGLPVAEIKKKKESLMATFRGHLKKKKESILSGSGVDEIYQPVWIFYDTMETFLGDIYQCSSKLNTVEIDSQVTEKRIGDLTESQQENVKKRKSTNSTNTPELIDAKKQMKMAFDTFNSVVEKTNEEDESDVFGKLIAKKMKKISDESIRSEIMLQILTIFQTCHQQVNNFSVSQSQHPVQSSSTNIIYPTTPIRISSPRLTLTSSVTSPNFMTQSIPTNMTNSPKIISNQRVSNSQIRNILKDINHDKTK